MSFATTHFPGFMVNSLLLPASKIISALLFQPDHPGKVQTLPQIIFSYRLASDLLVSIPCLGVGQLQAGTREQLNGVLPGGWTPLIMAACKGRFEIVRMLVEKGAKVNAGRFTALVLAAVRAIRERQTSDCDGGQC